VKRKVDARSTEAAARLIIAGHVNDADLNARLAEQDIAPLNPRQIRHIINSLKGGKLRILYSLAQVQHGQQGCSRT
jgi:hypothetical protein